MMPLGSTLTPRIMEKLPVHTGPRYEASSEPEWNGSHRRFRPNRVTYLRRIFITAICVFLGYYLLIRPAPKCTSPACVPEYRGSDDLPRKTLVEDPGSAEDHTVPSTEHSKTNVPLEVHIMSKCPDAQECFKDLIIPAMEKISDKVDFKLSFIASVSKESSEIECKHGPAECIGDMLMLCAANLPFPPKTVDAVLTRAYPRTPIIRSLGFANCLINDYTRIPERGFVHQCALEHAIDFEALNDCASQQNDDPNDGGRGKAPPSGLALLRDSALRSERLGAKISCTVRLDESVWCIRDGGEWKDCAQNGEGRKPQVLADEVQRLWKERN